MPANFKLPEFYLPITSTGTGLAFIEAAYPQDLGREFIVDLIEDDKAATLVAIYHFKDGAATDCSAQFVDKWMQENAFDWFNEGKLETEFPEFVRHFIDAKEFGEWCDDWLEQERESREYEKVRLSEFYHRHD